VSYLVGETKLQQWAGGKVYSLSKNIKVKFNGNRLSMPIYSSRRRLNSVLGEVNPDIVHVMVPYSPLMAQRVIAAAHRRGTAIIGSFHILPAGWLSSVGNYLLGLIQFVSLKKIDEFSATSQNAGQFAAKTMRIKSSVVPNMVDVAAFSAGRQVNKVPGQIVFLGRLVGRKGCAQLIKAFALVAKNNPDVRLVIAGDGPDRQKLERLAKKLGQEDKIKFLGFISEADKPKILGRAQITCFPALYGESFGLVLVEAMAAGGGVIIAGDNPGYRCVMGERPLQLVRAKDATKLADTINLFLADKEKAREALNWQMAEAGKYDVNVVGKQLLGLYDQAIAKHSESGA